MSSLLNPVFACRVIDEADGRALNTILLPHRPQAGDVFNMFGVSYKVVSTEVNWTGIVKIGMTQPDRIPCTVVVGK